MGVLAVGLPAADALVQTSLGIPGGMCGHSLKTRGNADNYWHLLTALAITADVPLSKAVNPSCTMVVRCQLVGSALENCYFCTLVPYSSNKWSSMWNKWSSM